MSDETTLEVMNERLKSLVELSGLRHDQLREELKPLRELPTRVSRVETRLDEGFRRLEAVEKRESGNTDWRRSDLPLIMVTVGLLIVGLIQALHG